MKKSVLCAVDVSNIDGDTEVLNTAIRMARMEGAVLDVVTVFPDFGMSPVGGFFSKDHHKTALEETKKLLQQKAQDAVANSAGGEIMLRCVVATGKVYSEVLRVAEIQDSDLIVIGAHKAQISDFLLGPNAARVVRHSRTSVLVVRD